MDSWTRRPTKSKLINICIVNIPVLEFTFGMLSGDLKDNIQKYYCTDTIRCEYKTLKWTELNKDTYEMFY